MDNFAHAFTGAVVGRALAPNITKPFSRRFLLANMAIANLPDIDLLLTLFGRKVYTYHHRGFTHSLFGLCLMIPIALILFRLIMGKDFFIKYKKMNIPKQLIIVITQLVFSHFFLDYLTSFGTMLLYPLSMQRFSFPLMFIIDPLFWLITGLGCLTCYLINWKSTKQRFLSALVTLCLIICLWGIEWSFKNRAHFLVKNIQARVQSYPMPLAPLLWNVIQLTPDSFLQHTVSFKNPAEPKIMRHSLLPFNQIDQKCQNLTNKKSRAHLEYYKSFAELPYCLSSQDGCHCVSLKYSIPALGKSSFAEQHFVNTPLKVSTKKRSRKDRWEKLKILY